MQLDTAIIADDHPLFRSALKQALLEQTPEAELVEAGSLSALQDCLEKDSDIDLLLLDLHIPGANGFSGLAYVRGRYPDVPVIMVSANEDRDIIRQAAQHGAAGFIPKSSSMDTICAAVSMVLEGDRWFPDGVDGAASAPPASEDEILKRVATLTPQQLRVLQMISAGMLNKQIAYDLEVSEATVKAHMTAIMRKLGVRTRTQAVLAVSNLDIKPQFGGESGGESGGDGETGTGVQD